MSLNPKSRQILKAKSHQLKPIVMLGNNGLSDAVKKEIERGLTDHELIKIRISTVDRDLRKQLYADICESSKAEPVQLIGNIAVIYRKNVDK